MPPTSQMASGTIQLIFILISCSLYSMYHPPPSSVPSSSSLLASSSSLALLVLVVSTCISLFFSNLRHLLIKGHAHKTQQSASPPPMEEPVKNQEEKSIVLLQDEVTEDAPVDFIGSMSESSDYTANDDASRTDDDSVSDDDDDESLIEISLVDGHYVGGGAGKGEQCALNEEKVLLAEFLPDLVLGKRDFIDILSEINEEDSLIEIDIARGSIKCSSLGIKA